MPVTKRTTPGTGSERLELTKSIIAVDSKMDGLKKALENLGNFKETMQKLDLQIDEKRLCLDELDKEFATKKKDNELEITQGIREFGRQKAIELLSSFGEVPIGDEELKALRSKLEALEKSHESELDDLKKKLKKQNDQACATLKNSLEMAYRTKEAENVANLKAKDQEISFLSKQIANLKEEISLQRELTKQVAQSSSVTQTFGGADGRSRWTDAVKVTRVTRDYEDSSSSSEEEPIVKKAVKTRKAVVKKAVMRRARARKVRILSDSSSTTEE